MNNKIFSNKFPHPITQKKTSSRRQDPNFKLINVPQSEFGKKQNKQENIANSSFKALQLTSKLILNNENSSETKNLFYQKKREKLHNLSYSPINNEELKIEKETAVSPDKIKNNNSSAKKNKSFVNLFDKINENKFEPPCENMNAYLLLAHENTIEKLTKSNESLKMNEKKLIEKISALQKENEDLRQKLKQKTYNEKTKFLNCSQIVKPIMIDEIAQVYIEDDEEEAKDKNEALLYYISSLESKINDIEINMNFLTKNSNDTQKTIIKNNDYEKNIYLENELKKALLQIKNDNTLVNKIQNERDFYKELLNNIAFLKTKKDEVNAISPIMPFPSYIGLLQLGKKIINNKK